MLLTEFQQQSAVVTLDQLRRGTYVGEGDHPLSDVSLQDILVNGDRAAAHALDLPDGAPALRLRIANAGSNWALRYAVAAHRLLAVALDGADIAPRLADAVVVYPGERVDAVLVPDNATGHSPGHSPGDAPGRRSFAIRIETLNGPAFGTGTLTRSAPAAALPPGLRDALAQAAPGAAAALDVAEGVAGLRAHAAAPRPPAGPGRAVRLRLGGSMRGYRWTINGSRFRAPPAPLTLPRGFEGAGPGATNVWRVQVRP